MRRCGEGVAGMVVGTKGVVESVQGEGSWTRQLSGGDLLAGPVWNLIFFVFVLRGGSIFTCMNGGGAYKTTGTPRVSQLVAQPVSRQRCWDVLHYLFKTPKKRTVSLPC